MRLSVIIPTWNEATNIVATITAVQAAGFDEIIVVDAGSLDDTVRLAGAAGADRVATSSPGRARQQNHGAALATGDLLCFFHADCLPHVESARAVRRAFSDPQVVAACFTQRLAAEGWPYRLLEWGNLRRVLWWGSAYGDQGLCVRRDVFERIGRFPEWKLMEDVELCRRLRGHGRMRVIDTPLTVSARRWEKRGILRQTVLNWTLLSMFHCGVSPNKLARFYTNIR